MRREKKRIFCDRISSNASNAQQFSIDFENGHSLTHICLGTWYATMEMGISKTKRKKTNRVDKHNNPFCDTIRNVAHQASAMPNAVSIPDKVINFQTRVRNLLKENDMTTIACEPTVVVVIARPMNECQMRPCTGSVSALGREATVHLQQ